MKQHVVIEENRKSYRLYTRCIGTQIIQYKVYKCTNSMYMSLNTTHQGISIARPVPVHRLPRLGSIGQRTAYTVCKSISLLYLVSYNSTRYTFAYICV